MRYRLNARSRASKIFGLSSLFVFVLGCLPHWHFALLAAIYLVIVGVTNCDIETAKDVNDGQLW